MNVHAVSGLPAGGVLSMLGDHMHVDARLGEVLGHIVDELALNKFVPAFIPLWV